MSAAVLRVMTQREPCDCAIAALAMYLGESYEDVLRVATTNDRHQGKKGLWRRTMLRMAARLGHTLRVTQAIDWEEDYGVLRLPAHAVVLRNGLVIDDGNIWDVDAYLANQNVERRDCELLRDAEDPR